MKTQNQYNKIYINTPGNILQQIYQLQLEQKITQQDAQILKKLTIQQCKEILIIQNTFEQKRDIIHLKNSLINVLNNNQSQSQEQGNDFRNNILSHHKREKQYSSQSLQSESQCSDDQQILNSLTSSSSSNTNSISHEMSFQQTSQRNRSPTFLSDEKEQIICLQQNTTDKLQNIKQSCQILRSNTYNNGDESDGNVEFRDIIQQQKLIKSQMNLLSQSELSTESPSNLMNYSSPIYGKARSFKDKKNNIHLSVKISNSNFKRRQRQESLISSSPKPQLLKA